MKNTQQKTPGLRQTIAMAKTKEEVNDLLVIGTQFQYTSVHTKQRWLNTARTRLAQLKAGAQCE